MSSEVVIFFLNGSNVDMQGHTGDVLAIKLIQNDLLVSGATDKTIIFWSLDTYTAKQSIEWHYSAVSALETVIGG